MGDRVDMIIVKLQRHFPHRIAEWICAVMMFSWGIACANVPAETWAMPMYSGLRNIMPQGSWAAFALLIGGGRIVALIINGAYCRTPHFRALGAFLAIFLWLPIAFAVFFSEVVAIAVAFYPWLCVADMYNVYRAAQDAGGSDCLTRERRGKGDAATTSAKS